MAKSRRGIKIPNSGLNWEDLKTAKSTQARKGWLETAYVGKYNCLSDAIVNRERGGQIAIEHIQKLAKAGVMSKSGRIDPDVHPRWRLKVLKKDDGTVPVPGDIIEWCRDTFHREDKKEGPKLTSSEMEAIRRRGEIDRLEEWGEAEVDQDGCISVGFHDALTMLHLWGVYYATGIAMTDKPETRGGKHHWRYMEVPPWAEKDLLKKPDPETDIELNLNSKKTEMAVSPARRGN
jgi:hypothetical protein